jgi:uncharacterized protein (TIGR03503 family)
MKKSRSRPGESTSVCRFCWTLLLFFCISHSLTSHATEPVTDLRVLIDVSGSMKHNDPHNLRAPALRLLVGLVPEGSRAGVWTFGQFVNMQVKLGRVNQAWKKMARDEAGKIHSNGLFTNIEEAIHRASFDWNKSDPRYRRHLILLTDGMVDISKNTLHNTASRQRIVKTLLPKLIAAHVKVHTIALSDNADHALLKTLSVATDGWYEQVDSADSLHRVFLRLFEKAAPVDTLPLKNNRFTVDSSITDMTVLAFHSAEAKTTRLVTPSKQEWTQAQHPNAVQWHNEQGYDLITVNKPQRGEWQLHAAIDNDNRVMVMTNLRLNVDDLPNNVLPADRLTVAARLVQDGKTITEKTFLEMVTFKLTQHIIGQQPAALQVLGDDGRVPDGREGDGTYSANLRIPSLKGDMAISVIAQGATFQREFRHTIKVYESPAEITTTYNQATKFHEIRVIPHQGLLQPDTIKILFTDAESKQSEMPQVNKELWKIDVPSHQAGKLVSILIMGTRFNGKFSQMELKRLLPEASPESIALSTVKKQDHIANEKQKTTRQTKSDVQQKKLSRWLSVIIIVFGVNTIVIAGVGGGYLFWRKKRTRTLAKEQVELRV